MADENFLAERFQEHRPRLRAVAYRMLGSLSESDDALQEAWLRASGADLAVVRNFEAWLTTIVGRVCLNMLRSRQLASRARRRVEGRAPAPDPDLAVQRTAVDAFFAAARNGDFEALVAVLHPDVVLRADGGVLRASQSATPSGARTVASQAQLARTMASYVQRVLINGAPGAFVVKDGKPISLMAFDIVAGKVASIQVILDPERLDEVARSLAA
jgi:ketosteroid isomerase-like protein